MKPRPGAPPCSPDYKSPTDIELAALSRQIDQIGKNCGGIEELATKVDELVNIMTSCPHCRKKLEG